jgi:hypothetical protein
MRSFLKNIKSGARSVHYSKTLFSNVGDDARRYAKSSKRVARPTGQRKYQISTRGVASALMEQRYSDLLKEENT